MVSTQFPKPLKKTFNMEMQEQSVLNEMMCDEIHKIKDKNGQQDYRGPMTRSYDPRNHRNFHGRESRSE